MHVAFNIDSYCKRAVKTCHLSDARFSSRSRRGPEIPAHGIHTIQHTTYNIRYSVHMKIFSLKKKTFPYHESDRIHMRHVRCSLFSIASFFAPKKIKKSFKKSLNSQLQADHSFFFSHVAPSFLHPSTICLPRLSHLSLLCCPILSRSLNPCNLLTLHCRAYPCTSGFQMIQQIFMLLRNRFSGAESQVNNTQSPVCLSR